MMKSLACGDIAPGCGFRAAASTEEELLKRVAAHAKDAHGVSKVTPELLTKVHAAITTN